jgi:hypothetical protein
MSEAKGSTLEKAIRAIQAAEGDDLTPVPASVLRRAQAALTNSEQRVARDLPLEEMQAIADYLRLMIAQNNLKMRLRVGGQLRDAAEVERESIGEITSTIGDKDADVTERPNDVIYNVAHGYNVSPLVMVAQWSGRDGTTSRVLIDDPRQAEEDRDGRNQAAADAANQSIAALGVTPDQLRAMSRVLGGRGRRRMGKWQGARSVTVRLPGAQVWDAQHQMHGAAIGSKAMTRAELVMLWLHLSDPDTREQAIKNRTMGFILRSDRGEQIVHFTDETVKAIDAQVTDQEKALARSLRDYVNKTIFPDVQKRHVEETGTRLREHENHVHRERWF